MKSILICTDYFFPGNSAGGPVTSISNLYRFLEHSFKAVILTRNFDLSDKVPYDGVIYDKPTAFERYSVVYLSRLGLGSVLSSINCVRPDIIYLNSLFSKFTRIVLLLRFFGVIKCEIILAPRGEFQANAIAMKRTRKLLYINLMRVFGLSRGIVFHATDRIEAERVKLFFKRSDIVTLPNLPRPISASPRQKRKSELRLVFIGRIRNNKNLLYAIRALSKCEVDVSLDVYGPVEDEKYWSECTDLIGQLSQRIVVRYKGLLPHGDIPTALLEYHALLLPTETENFGHAIVEAMQSGVVPIISNQTPWQNLAAANAGWDIDLSRPDLFVNAIRHLHAMDPDVYAELSASTMRYIQDKLKIDELAQEYVKIFNQSHGH